MTCLIKSLAGAVALFAASPALADAITPSSFSAAIDVGETVSLNKVVTINAGRPTSALVDVMFLTDTTGSVSPTLSAIRSQFSGITTNLAGLGNVAFGLAEYKDIFDGLPVRGAYRLNRDLTTNASLVQTAINGLSASGGGDLPEANLIGLEEVSDVSWRTGSTRFLVWSGDAPGHDPRDGTTLASAISALNGENVRVIGINAPSGPGLNSTGQATAVATATGGQYFDAATPSQISGIINDAVTTIVSNYTEVCLDPSGAPGGVGVTTSACITGVFDRSIDRTFDFTVAFNGVTPGAYNFPIYATVDGGIVATETDAISVGGVTTVPEPLSIMTLGTALAGFGLVRRRQAKSC